MRKALDCIGIWARHARPLLAFAIIAIALLFGPGPAHAATFNLNCGVALSSVSDSVGTGAVSDTINVSNATAGQTITFVSTHQAGGNTEITISSAGATPSPQTFTVSNSTTTHSSIFTFSATGSTSFSYAISGSSTGGRLVNWTATCTGAPSASFTVTKTPSVASISAPGTVNYTIAVVNTGNVQLTGVTIADPLTGDEACPATTIAVGGTLNCTASFAVTQAVIDGNGVDINGAIDGDGDIDNTATVDTAETASQQASAAVTITQTPSFTVTKTPSVASVSAPGTINYTIAVVNTGNVQLTGVTISDPLTGDEACPATTIAVGGTLNCTASFAVTQAVIDGNGVDINGAIDGDGDIDNTATVDTAETASQQASAAVTITQTPSFTVTKTPSVASISAPGTVNYTIAVVNTGNVQLTGVTITDPLTGDEACPATTVAVGGTLNCTASFAVTQAVIDGNGVDTTGAIDGDGDIDNTATVDTAETASQQASAAVTITQTPSFTVTKTPSVASISAPGTVNYTIAVVNTGNVALTGVTIADPLTGDEACPATTIAVGGTLNCTASFAVTQAVIDGNGVDINGAIDGDGDIDNTATVDTAETASQQASAAVTITQTPSFTVTKRSPNTGYGNAGDRLDYEIVVANVGNVTLSGVAIDDPLTSNEACPSTTVAPGATMICTASYVVTQTDVDNGAVNNIASVDTDQSAPRTTNQVTIRATQSGSLSAVKSSPEAAFGAVGDVLTYQIVVTNTGNITITGLTIDDPLTSDEACPVTTLAPAQSTTCTASYTVTQQDLLNGSVSNTAFVQSNQSRATASNPVRIEFDRSQARSRTSNIISNFMSRRADQITASDPNLVSRLSDCATGRTPFAVSGDADSDSERFSFATSLRQMAGSSKTAKPEQPEKRRECSGFDIWASGQWSRNDAEGTANELGLFYLGVDYYVSPSLVVGMLAQFDHSSEIDHIENFTVRGEGWLVGPYVVGRLTDTLIFDGRLAWGRSTNKINPLGFYEDEFETERWLARARLTGDYRFGNLQFMPHVGVIYFSETQEAYTDGLNTTIPSQTVSLGRFTFGPRIGYTLRGRNGELITPQIGVTGIWDFDKAEIVDLTTGRPTGGSSDIRARIEAGVGISLPNGLSLRGEGFYDGVGSEDTEAYGGRLRLNLPLN